MVLLAEDLKCMLNNLFTITIEGHEKGNEVWIQQHRDYSVDESIEIVEQAAEDLYRVAEDIKKTRLLTVVKSSSTNG